MYILFLQRADLSRVINLLVDIKLTVEDMNTRLHHLEATNLEKAKLPGITIREKVNDHETLHRFLNEIRGKEEEYVSDITFEKRKTFRNQ